MDTKMITLNDKEEKRLVEETFKDENITPEIVNLIRVAVAAHEHAFHKLTTKKAFMRWVEQAWDAGKHQSRVYNGEIEGGILNVDGVIGNFTAAIVLYGEDRKLISTITR